MRDGWKEISLENLEISKVIKLGRGDVISKKDMQADPGPNPVYSSAENKNGMIGKYAKYMFDEELITWSVDGGGHIFHRPKHKFSVTNIGGWLRILDDQVFSYQFLTYALQMLHKQHHFDWQHKAHPSVIRKLYTRIPLPPLPEQKRIVDLISSVDSYIEALQKQLESAKKSRNAVLHELLTAGGDDWIESKLSGVTVLITDGSHFSPPTTDTGIPYVTVRDIKNGQLDLDNSARISKQSFDELEKNGCSPLMNDILFSKDGTVGKVSLVSTKEKFVVLSSLAIIRANTKIVLPKFLAITLSAPDFQRDAIGSKTGLAIKRIVLKHLRQLSINIPPILEQSRITGLIEVLDEVINKTEQTLIDSKKLRSSLLNGLLSGEHEIPTSYDKFIGAA
jgi:type I restriction enzyme S subunit